MIHWTSPEAAFGSSVFKNHLCQQVPGEGFHLIFKQIIPSDISNIYFMYFGILAIGLNEKPNYVISIIVKQINQ